MTWNNDQEVAVKLTEAEIELLLVLTHNLRINVKKSKIADIQPSFHNLLDDIDQKLNIAGNIAKKIRLDKDLQKYR